MRGTARWAVRKGGSARQSPSRSRRASRAPRSARRTCRTPIYGSGGSAVTATMRQVASSAPFASRAHHRALARSGSVPRLRPFRGWNDSGHDDAQRRLLGRRGRGDDVPGADGGRAAGRLRAHGQTTRTFAQHSERQSEGVGDFFAPVQTVNIVTDKDSIADIDLAPKRSTYIFGLGAAAAEVEPWTNPRHIFLRDASSFVHQFIAASVFGDPHKVFYDHPSTPGASGASRVRKASRASSRPAPRIPNRRSDTSRARPRTPAAPRSRRSRTSTSVRRARTGPIRANRRSTSSTFVRASTTSGRPDTSSRP